MIFVHPSRRTVFVGDAVDPELHAAAFEESAADATKLALRPYQPEDPGCFASRLSLIMDAVRRDRPTFAPVQVCRPRARHPPTMSETCVHACETHYCNFNCTTFGKSRF